MKQIKNGIYARLLTFVKPYWKRFILALLCMVFTGGLSAVMLWLIKDMVDKVLLNKNIFLLNLIPFLIIGISLLQGVFNYGQRYLMHWIGQKVVFDIRNKLYSHLQRLSLSFFSHKPVGEIISRLTSDITTMQNALSRAIGDIVKEGVTVVALVGLLIYFNWQLALISLAILPFVVKLTTNLSNKLRKMSRKVRKKMATLTSVIQETFSSIRIVKAFSMEKYEREKFKNRSKEYFKAEMKSQQIAALISPLVSLISSFGIAFIVWFGGKQVIEGAMTAGEFVAFMGGLLSLYRPMARLGDVSSVIQQAVASGERVFEILNITPDIKNPSNPVVISEFKDKIKFENVSFKYDEEVVLKDINFEINKGEIVAIVGPSGAGKTTIANLLARFYDPDKGRILIDGNDLRQVDILSLRNLLGIVTQDTILFNDTIYNNISYGKPEATEKEVIEAAKAANAHSFIEKMRNGYQTYIHERGQRLSGGQQQRIAIARALLKNPSILILDEATSEMDSESETLIQEALSRLLQSRTALVIAHRLSTIKSADKIVVLKDGRIVEMGKHNELMKKSGYYRYLYELQFRETSQT
ncbi:ABC transporter ATP-binding protein [Candidatus Aerophobetes bacterium]|nr:ABC transporter ATP-binding protein [Candidatus Aerophobetes bacterium]